MSKPLRLLLITVAILTILLVIFFYSGNSEFHTRPSIPAPPTPNAFDDFDLAYKNVHDVDKATSSLAMTITDLAHQTYLN